jgi:hypothetical protein
MSLYHFAEWFTHVSTVLGLRRKHRVTPKMFGAPVKNLTNRVCYLACMR